MKAVAQYNRKEIIGNIPSVQPSMAQPRFFSEFSEQIQRFEHKFTEQAKQKYAFQLDSARKQEINRISQEYKGDPEGMQKAFEANCSGLSETIEHPELKEQFNTAYSLETMGLINRAQAEKERRLDEENTVATLNNISTTKDGMIKSIPDLWSSDPVAIKIAGENLKKGFADIATALQSRKGDGSYLLSPETVAAGLRPFVDEFGKHLSLSYLEKSEDKKKAIQDFFAGNIGVDIADEDGKSFRFNLKEAMTPDAFNKTKEVLEGKISTIIARQALDLNAEDSEQALEFIKKSIPKEYEDRDILIENATTEYLSRLNVSQRLNKENKLITNSKLAEDLLLSIQNGTADALEMDERILAIEDAGTRMAFQNYRAQNGNVITEPAVFMMLSKLARENPNDFSDTDLTHYIDRLSPYDFKTLQAAQIDVQNKKKGGDSNGAYTSLMSNADYINRYLNLLGIKDPKDNPEEAYKAKQLLELAINDLETQKYAGKQKATSQDIENVILRLAGNFKERDWIFDNDIKLKQIAGQPVEKRAKVYQPFNLIDGDDLSSLNGFLSQKGIVGDPTKDDELKKLYENLYPAVLAGDRETINFLVLKYKGR